MFRVNHATALRFPQANPRKDTVYRYLYSGELLTEIQLIIERWRTFPLGTPDGGAEVGLAALAEDAVRLLALGRVARDHLLQIKKKKSTNMKRVANHSQALAA